MTLLLPNIQSAPTYDGQAVSDAVDFGVLTGRYGFVTSGCAVTALGTPGFAVAVASGSVSINGSSYTVTANGNLAPSATNTTDRRDLVLVGTNGLPYVKAGTPCSVAGWTRLTPSLPPVKPTPDANTAVLAELYIPGNVASPPLRNNQEILDKTFKGQVGPAGSLPPGTDASIPAASSVNAGTTRLSTDLNGGTPKVSDGVSSWLLGGPGVNQIGGIEIVGAHPAAGSIAGWLYPIIGQTAGAPVPHVAIPQLVPASFTMPSRPVTVVLYLPNGLTNVPFVLGSNAIVGLEFTKNAGANWYTLAFEPLVSTTIGGVLSGLTLTGYLPTASVSTSPTSRVVVAGDTVQVRAFVALDSSRTVTDGATNSNTTVTSNTAQFTSADIGKEISGGTIPAGAKISSLTNPFTAVISSAASGTATGVTLRIGRQARSVADGVLNATTTVTSATAVFTSGDVGRCIQGGTIPASTTIASVTNATTVVLSAAATGSASGVTLNIGDWYQLVCGDDVLGASNANYWPFVSVISI